MKALVWATRSAVRELLSEVGAQRGYQLRFAASAEEALDALQAERPALVILDVDEAPAAALGFCRAVKQTAVPPLLLALVASGSRAALGELLRSGVDDLLEHPLDRDSLQARLQIVEKRSSTEAALREGEEKFRSMVSNLPGVVYRSVADTRGEELGRATARRLEFINDQVEAQTGYPAADFLSGKLTYASLVHPDDATQVIETIDRATAAHLPFELEYRLLRPDGEVRWISSRGRGVFNAIGEFIGVDGAVFDITPEKLARERLAEKSAELGALNAELHALQEKKDRSFMNVTHELRTPLTLILSPLEDMLARPGALSPEDRPRFEAMHRNCLRLLSLINDLLDLAKLQSTDLAVQKQAVDVGAFARRLLEDVAPGAEAKELALSLDAPEAIPPYLLDAQHLERILFNLLSNAFKFTPPNGRVEVSLREDEEGLALAVQDSGIGIPLAAQARIFQRFEQVDDGTTRQHGGTGIGLALVAELARILGARVSVLSTEGAGARFTVHVPRALRLEQALTVERARAAESSSTALARRGALAALAPVQQAVGRLQGGDARPPGLGRRGQPRGERRVARAASGGLPRHHRARRRGSAARGPEANPGRPDLRRHDAQDGRPHAVCGPA